MNDCISLLRDLTECPETDKASIMMWVSERIRIMVDEANAHQSRQTTEVSPLFDAMRLAACTFALDTNIIAVNHTFSMLVGNTSAARDARIDSVFDLVDSTNAAALAGAMVKCLLAVSGGDASLDTVVRLKFKTRDAPMEVNCRLSVILSAGSKPQAFMCLVDVAQDSPTFHPTPGGQTQDSDQKLHWVRRCCPFPFFLLESVGCVLICGFAQESKEVTESDLEWLDFDPSFTSLTFSLPIAETEQGGGNGGEPVETTWVQ